MHSEVGRSEDDRLSLSKNMVAEQPLQVAGEMSSSFAQQLHVPSEVVHQVGGPVKGRLAIPSSDASVGSASTTHTLSSAFTDMLVSSSNENADTCTPIQDGGSSTRRRRRKPAHDDSSSAAKTSQDADTLLVLKTENSRLKEEMRTMRRALHRSSAVTAQDDQTELIMQLKLEIAELSTNLDEARMATLSEKGAGDCRLVDLKNLLAETQRQLVEAKTKSSSTDTIFVVVEKDEKDQTGRGAASSSAVEQSGVVDNIRFQAIQEEEMAGLEEDAKKARKELDLARKENQRLRRVQEITKSLQTEKVGQTNDKIEELEKQLSECKVQIAELKSELEGSENTSNHLMEETSQLANQISTLITEKSDLFAKINKYKQVVPSMKQSLTKLQKDKIELRVRLEAAEVLAEEYKKRYIRLGESLAGISMADLEDLLHKDDLDRIREERERKEQEKKGKLRRMFEGSTIGMALTETIGSGSGENTDGIRRRRSLSDAEFAFEADLRSEDPPALSPPLSRRLSRRARSFDFGEVNDQQMLNHANSVDGVNVNERRPRRSRRSSNLSSGRRLRRSRSVDPSEMRLDIDIIGVEGGDNDDGCATSARKQSRQPRQARRSSAIVASSRRRSSSADPYSTKRSSMPNSRSGSKTGSLADSLANVLEGVYSANMTMSEANNSSARTGIDSIAESSMNSLGDDWIEQCVVTAFQFEGCNSDSSALNVDLDDIAGRDKDDAVQQATEMPSAKGESAGARDVDD